MKKLLSLQMELRPFRVIAAVFAILILMPIIVLFFGVFIEKLGYELSPAYTKLRIGMSPEKVRDILGEPDGVATLDEGENKHREDWWYKKDEVMQLTFESGRLVSNHSKNHLLK